MTTALSDSTATVSADGPSLDEILARLRAAWPELVEQYRILSLGVFGSYVRGHAHAESDLDLLVDFVDPPSLFLFLELQEQLSLIAGVPVDLVMKAGLKPNIGKHILVEVIPV